jgi:hypothetical protein
LDRFSAIKSLGRCALGHYVPEKIFSYYTALMRRLRWLPLVATETDGSSFMASIAVDVNDLVVRLSALEKIAALLGDIHLPLTSVRVVRVSDTPWSGLRGIRASGTGVPGVISLWPVPMVSPPG